MFDLLRQVLGEARLTDGRGRTTYFHNAIIVLTSNLGTRSAKGTLGLAPAIDRTFHSGKPYTAWLSISGASWLKPYQEE